MHVAVYLAAIPAKTKNQSKRDLLTKFAHGVIAAGDQVTFVDQLDHVVDADIAVMQGWIGMKHAPHLDLRRKVIESNRVKNKPTLVIDSNLFGFLDPNDRDKYLRYSIGGIFPTTGYYFEQDLDTTRWIEIKSAYVFDERPWNNKGEHVLVCLQRDGGWSMDGLRILDWLDMIIPQIMTATDRSIVIRGHPGNLKTLPDVAKKWPDLRISNSADIRSDLDRAWCTVTYNSSPGVASLLWGVPVFITDPVPERSQAFGFASTNLSEIESPIRPERQVLYHRLAQCHFATANLASGEAWRFMRQRLPNISCQ